MNSIAGYYNNKEQYSPSGERVRRVVQILGNDIKGKKILDIGCGNGTMGKALKEKGAIVFGKNMATKSKQYGVIEVKNGKVVSIEEKPDKPKSQIGQTGIYMYDGRVFDFIKKQSPSKRGELEVTDLNNIYVKEKTLFCKILTGWWVDAGTSFDELLKANIIVAKEITKQIAVVPIFTPLSFKKV